MLTDFFKRLRTQPAEQPLPELDAQLAVGSLLVRLAKADSHYAVEEIAKIDMLLAAANGLNPVEAAKMRATCEKLEAQAPATVEFTEIVQDSVALEDRRQVLDALWQVSLADRALKPEEEAFLTTIAAALGLAQADTDAIRARLTQA